MTTSDGGTTRARILEVALDLFTAKGYEATTTREITAELGITPAALYYHFPGKEDCLAALVEPYFDLVEGMLGDRPGPVSSSDEARAFLTAYRELLESHDRVATLVERDRAVATHAELGPRLAELIRKVRTTLAGPNPDEAAVVRASAALGALRRPTLLLNGAPEEKGDIAVEAALSALGIETRNR